MAMKLAVTAKNAGLDAKYTTAIGTSGLLRGYSGTQPTNPDTALSGNTLLFECALSSAFAAAASGGVLTANAITADSSADNTGTLSFCSLLTSGGTRKVDLTAGTSGADINFNTLSIVSGAQVSVTSLTITSRLSSLTCRLTQLPYSYGETGGSAMKKYIVTLTEDERLSLSSLASSGKAAAKRITHARILLKADAAEGGPAWRDADIALALDVDVRTVERVRERFVEQGLEAALVRKPQARPSRLPVLDGDAEARLIALACSRPPEGRARWTLRLLAGRLVELEVVEAVSHETVRRTLQKTS
jgi:hypothetical protein